MIIDFSFDRIQLTRWRVFGSHRKTKRTKSRPGDDCRDETSSLWGGGGGGGEETSNKGSNEHKE